MCTVIYVVLTTVILAMLAHMNLVTWKAHTRMDKFTSIGFLFVTAFIGFGLVVPLMAVVNSMWAD